MIVFGADMHKSLYTIVVIAVAMGAVLDDKIVVVGVCGFDVVLWWV